MKVYVAGPMRGIAQFNFPAFHDATERLRALGHEVFNPAERDADVGFDPTEMDGDENLAELGFSLREALAADTEYISKHAEAIALLPGWESSSGARAEVVLAHALGLNVWLADEFGMTVVLPDTTSAMPSILDAAKALQQAGELRLTSSTGGQKGTKPERFDLIPAGPLRQLAHLYGNGAQKYEDRNWERGYDWSLSFAAMQRHLWLFWNGEDIDKEMQLPHLICAVFHAFALTEFLETHPEFDNRATS